MMSPEVSWLFFKAPATSISKWIRKRSQRSASALAREISRLASECQPYFDKSARLTLGCRYDNRLFLGMLDRLNELVCTARRNLRQNFRPFLVSRTDDCSAAKLCREAFNSFDFLIELVALNRQFQAGIGQRWKAHIFISGLLQQFLELGSIGGRL